MGNGPEDRPSFTIEFAEHLPSKKSQYCLTQLRNAGASVVPQNDRTFLIVCSKPNQLAHVGWLLFHSHFQNLCRVISTSGGADSRASAYRRPSHS
jgi:hypothetical protein